MRMLIIAMALGLGACVNAPGAADRPAPFAAAVAPAPVTAPAQDYPIAIDLPAGTYAADPHHASVTWRVRHQGLAWLTARFIGAEARLELDPADPTRSTLTASVQTASVDTGILGDNGARNFDGQIARLLGAETTPRITFTSTSIVRTGQNTGRMTGDLTLNGQTHPAIFDVVYDGGHTDPVRARTALGFSATTTIQRSQWGATQWSAFVGDDVQIIVEIEFLKTAS